MITIPVTGLQSPLFHMLNEESRTMVEKRIEERIKGDMAEIHEKSGYNVIWVSVAAGYSDQVIDTAEPPGQRGGRYCGASAAIPKTSVSISGFPCRTNRILF